MAKKSTTSLEVMIFMAFGLVLAVIIITVWLVPKVVEMIQGQCWANMYRTVDSIKASFSDPKAETETQRITIGDCAGGIIIFNRNDLEGGNAKGYEELVKDTCGTYAYKSYIIALPFKTISEEARKDSGFLKNYLNWLTHPVLSFQGVWKEGRQFITRVKPICKGIDNAVFTDAHCIPNGVCCTYNQENAECKKQNSKLLSDLVIERINQKTTEFCYRTKVIDGQGEKIYQIIPYECSKV